MTSRGQIICFCYFASRGRSAVRKSAAGADAREAVPRPVERPLALPCRRVRVAVDRDVDQADRLARRGAARTRDTGDPEADVGVQPLAGTAGERRRHDCRDGAVGVDELRRDVREDGLGVVRIDRRATLVDIAGATVLGEDRGEQPAGARLRGRDRAPRRQKPPLDDEHPFREVLIGRGSLRLRHYLVTTAGRCARRPGLQPRGCPAPDR